MPRTKEGFLWTAKETTEGLSTSAVQPSSPDPKSHYDVIVIGAGFAGLIAARDLSQKHHLDVLLLEARDRIGGRTWTAKVLGEEIEMGGTWVHWAQPHLYAELHSYGLHRNLKTSAGMIAPERQSFTPLSGMVQDVSIPECADVLERVARRVFTIDGLDSRALMPYPHDSLREPAPWKRYDYLSVRDRLDRLDDVDEREKELFDSNISTFGSAPGKEIGFVEALRWYALGGHSMAGVFELAGVFKLGNGGMTAFALAILGEYTGDRIFGAAVSEIRQVRNGVEIGTGCGRKWKAKTVVSTIPLNCLGDIKFSPPLSPLRQAAVTQGHINKGAKIHFKLRETLPGWFWTGSGYGDSSFLFAFSDHNGTQPSGPAGTWCIGFGYTGKLGDKKDSRHILEEFRKNINPNVNVDAYATHDWMNDPYAKGVWACWGPNAASKYLQVLQQRHGRIVFASADWADGWRGFVDGAIEQGHAAVRETVRLLKEDEPGVARL
ncbi:amine oxidase [Aspergillus sclerotiicarbonarius CBS 121057]|uniref:Amine oxidase n=1 Tax=Aspergillus sclerotiicarbonarius (strain CBS 121057 / IBT 28362) TaxID=1448318 RepID=A0A319E9H2_ASPSB|nr:amine oxidase [Aspergillus sclerotiicarbonarius CBS 121057]